MSLAIISVKKTYLSTRPPKRGFWLALWSAMILATLSMAYWQDTLGLEHLLAADGKNVFGHHEYWRLVTTIAVHADFKHLGSNLVFFSILSFLLSAYFGFWVYPVLTLLLGAATNLLALSTYAPNVTLMGASGVVYVMAGFWLMSYFLIERGQTLGNRAIRCVGFVLILLIPDAFSPVVSYRTHAIGFLLGWCAALPHYFARRQRLRAAEVLKIETDSDIPPDLSHEEAIAAGNQPDGGDKLSEDAQRRTGREKLDSQRNAQAEPQAAVIMPIKKR